MHQACACVLNKQLDNVHLLDSAESVLNLAIHNLGLCCDHNALIIRDVLPIGTAQRLVITGIPEDSLRRQPVNFTRMNKIKYKK